MARKDVEVSRTGTADDIDERFRAGERKEKKKGIDRSEFD
jgi:hypothetical protein